MGQVLQAGVSWCPCLITIYLMHTYTVRMGKQKQRVNLTKGSGDAMADRGDGKTDGRVGNPKTRWPIKKNQEGEKQRNQEMKWQTAQSNWDGQHLVQHRTKWGIQKVYNFTNKGKPFVWPIPTSLHNSFIIYAWGRGLLLIWKRYSNIASLYWLT